MEWLQIMTIIFSIFGMVLFFMRELNSFRQSVENNMQEFRREIKDFHGRLCRLEEKYLMWIKERK